MLTRDESVDLRARLDVVESRSRQTGRLLAALLAFGVAVVAIVDAATSTRQTIHVSLAEPASADRAARVGSEGGTR